MHKQYATKTEQKKKSVALCSPRNELWSGVNISQQWILRLYV